MYINLNMGVLPLSLVILSMLSMAHGKLYPIAEPDLLEEIDQGIERAMSRVNEYTKKIRENINRYVPGYLSTLRIAEKSYRYEVDMTAELEFDIPKVNKNGEVIGVLYPKGFKFNVLKHMPSLPPVLVVFNPESEKEVLYVQENIMTKLKNKDVMLLVAGGNLSRLFDTMKTFRRKVYFLHSNLAERLKLRNTISVVSWDKDRGKAIVEVIGKDVLDKD